MKELALKYGCNPNQGQARVYMEDGRDLPFTVLNGRPGYINLLDAMNSWQLVRDLARATGQVAATSFKHVSPTSAALGRPMSEALKKACFVDDLEGLDSSPLAMAYARARGTDRQSSFGDWIALSSVCDRMTAKVIKREVSDGIIAPGYEPEALEILKSKRGGSYAILQIDPGYEAGVLERREVFGITFQQEHNHLPIEASLLNEVVTKKKELPEAIRHELLLGMITLKYTQSNSVCYVCDGQAIGVGAGQQSRILCTELAGQKADLWLLRQHPQVLALPFRGDLKRADRDNAVSQYLGARSEELLADGAWQRFFERKPEALTEAEKARYIQAQDGLCLASDAFFPFSDNIERAARSGVRYVAQPGGSKRDQEVIDACDRLGLVMVFTHVRLFHH